MVMKAKLLKLEDVKYMDLSNFIFERKFDGSRTLLRSGRLVSDKRDGFKNERYLNVVKALQGINATLDGELWVEADRVTELSKKENWDSAVFMVFDILEKDGQDLTQLPLKERRKILEDLNIENDYVKLTEQFTDDFETLWENVENLKWEGLIAKDINSTYADKRSPLWFKLKRYEEVVVTIDEWEQGKNHGVFICNDGVINDIRVSTLSTQYVDEYLKAKENNKVVKMELQYLNKTTTGHYFQPCLKRLIL